MQTANELLGDAAISHQIDLTRYSEGVVRAMVRVLDSADARLFAELMVALDGLGPDSFTAERLLLALQSVRATNLAAYRALERDLTDELRRFAAVESDIVYAMHVAAVPAQVLAAVSFVRIDPERVYAAAMARPFQGRLLRDWFASLADDRVQRRISDVIATGFVNGRTVDQMVREIRGTRARGYRDGLLEIDRRHAQAVVRTATHHMAATVNDRFVAENADIIKGRRWLATLDTRTSQLCRIRDGRPYTNEERPKPIGHTIPWLAGPGKLHWNCRSTSTEILKSWRELGIDADNVSTGTRASMDGQVPKETTYSEWFARQSAKRQDEIVGPTRGRLMRDGKLPFDALYSARGDYLTLAQLRARYADAFKAAGVE